MRSALWRATLLASLVLTMDRPTDAASGTAPVCSPVRVGLDTTQANTYLVFYTGRSYGQTFTTGDTLIESITFWRGSPTPVDNTPLRLFITEVDSAGKPDVFHIVNSSAVIVVPPGDRCTRRQVCSRSPLHWRCPTAACSALWCTMISIAATQNRCSGAHWIRIPTVARGSSRRTLTARTSGLLSVARAGRRMT